MKVDNYVEILYKVVSDSKNEKELEKNINSFLEFVSSENDVHLLKKIYVSFSNRFSKRENVERVMLEYGENGGDDAKIVKQVRKLYENIGKEALIESRANKNLISGIRIIENDSRLIEASFNKSLNQLFNQV